MIGGDDDGGGGDGDNEMECLGLGENGQVVDVGHL